MPSLTPSAASHDPNGGSTAPVLEFVCLFTHDLKRKQKRWQDGRVKYHTFNKRVMVYDERGNFVGDMHWHRDWDFDEGEEVELERGGVIVQVSECVGRQDQDLSELLDKRAMEKEQRAASRSSILKPVNTASPMRRFPAPQNHFQTRHRPLHQVIGTPTGHHGRALVPSESPFEQKHGTSNRLGDEDDSRRSKRRKYDITPPSKMGYAQSLFGAPLTLSGVPASSAPLRRLAAAQQPRLGGSSPPQGVNSVTQSTPRQSPVDVATLSSSAGLERDRILAKSHHREWEGQKPRSATTSPRGHGAHSAADGCVTSAHFDDTCKTIEADQPYVPHFCNTTRLVLTESAKPAAVAKMRRDDGRGRRDALIPDASQQERGNILDDDSNEVIERPHKAISRGRLGTMVAASKFIAPRARKKRTPERQRTPLLRSPSPLRESTPNILLPTTAELDSGSELLRKENRTELRLKPRQKRGLLMVSDLPKKSKHHKTRKERAGDVKDDLPNVDVPKDERISALVPGMSEPPREYDDPFASSPTTEQVAVGEASLTYSHPWHHGTGTESGDRRRGNSASLGLVDGTTLRAPGPTKRQTKLKLAIHDESENTEDDCTHSLSPSLHLDGPAWTTICEETLEPARSPKYGRRSCRADTDSDRDCVSLDHTTVSATRKTLTRQIRKETVPRALEAGPVEAALGKTRNISQRREDSDQDLPQVPVGPRLARLSRKSVKSKEVIGFIIPSSPATEEPNPPAHIGDSTADEFDPTPAGFASVLVPEGKGARSVIEANITPEMRVPAPPGAQISLDLAPDGTDSSKRQQTSLQERCREQTADCIEQDLTGEDAMRNGTDRRPNRPGVVRHQSAVITTGSGRAGDMFASGILRGSKECAHSESEPLSAGPPIITETEDFDRGGKNDVQPESHKDSDPLAYQASASMASHSIEGGAIDNAAPDMPPTAAPTNPRPRIPNPATKGRKAALKSDAAGQVPQSILPPTEPVLARWSLQTVAETRKDSSGNERPKRKMTFPGFTSARGGGPWSREAHDLLEGGRPV